MQPPFQHHRSVVATFCAWRIGRDVRAVGGIPAEAFESGQGGVSDGGFCKSSHVFNQSA